jgi:hypothetical protein
MRDQAYLVPKQEREPSKMPRVATRSSDRLAARELFAQAHAPRHSRDAVSTDATMLKAALSPSRSAPGSAPGA